MGILDQVFPTREQCHAAVMDYCAQLAAGPAEAIGHAKLAARLGATGSLEAGLALEREAVARVFASDDAAEGITAFTEHRDPTFTGR
ncbi:MAG: hypothetical protein GEV03_05435 [Streptosporangiales bacterium]|nr:hypothetical protein [Streptosporangiales bacterium]